MADKIQKFLHFQNRQNALQIDILFVAVFEKPMLRRKNFATETIHRRQTALPKTSANIRALSPGRRLR